MNWIFLILAGLMEVGWVLSLKFSEGFTKIIPLIFYAVFGFLGALFFSNSIKNIPISIAYTIWVGIAIIGMSIYEIFFLNRPLSGIKMLYILLIIAGIIGLKLSSTGIK